jgi:hypothetical protein
VLAVLDLILPCLFPLVLLWEFLDLDLPEGTAAAFVRGERLSLCVVLLPKVDQMLICYGLTWVACSAFCAFTCSVPQVA